MEKKAEKELINRLVHICKGMRVGNPFDSSRTSDLGAMASINQIRHVESLIKDAVSKGIVGKKKKSKGKKQVTLREKQNKGAVIHFGGKREESLSPGLFMQVCHYNPFCF